MTDYTSNPFFQSPYIAQAGNNLIKAFNDDGHIALNRAHAGYYNAERDKIANEGAGREATASAIQSQDFGGPIANQFWSGLAANGIRSGQDPAQVAKAIMFLRANSKASNEDIAAAVVGSKGGLNVNEGVSLGDRNAISQKSEDAAFNRTKYSADSSAGASRANNADTLAFHERHAFDAPIQVAPEHAVYPNANDPRMKGVVSGSMPVPRMVTAFDTNSPTKESRQEDRVGTPIPVKSDRLITQFDATSPTGGVRAVDAPGVIPAAKEEKPLTLTPSAAADMKFNVFQGIPGAMAADGKSVDPAFQQQFGEKIQAAEIAAGVEYKRSRDASAAEKVFKDTLGIRPNQSFHGNPSPILPGIFGRGGMQPANAAPSAPAGTTQAAPSIAGNFAPPAAAAPAGLAPLPTDKGQLKVGQTYQTAKGPATWNGKNFDPAGQQNANDGAR